MKKPKEELTFKKLLLLSLFNLIKIILPEKKGFIAGLVVGPLIVMINIMLGNSIFYGWNILFSSFIITCFLFIINGKKRESDFIFSLGVTIMIIIPAIILILFYLFYLCYWLDNINTMGYVFKE